MHLICCYSRCISARRSWENDGRTTRLPSRSKDFFQQYKYISTYRLVNDGRSFFHLCRFTYILVSLTFSNSCPGDVRSVAQSNPTSRRALATSRQCSSIEPPCTPPTASQRETCHALTNTALTCLAMAATPALQSKLQRSDMMD